MDFANAIATTPTLRLAAKVVCHPQRALLRLILLGRSRRLDIERERTRLFSLLHEQFGADGPALREEYLASRFLRWSRERRAELKRFSRLRLGSTSDFTCEALYLVIRAAQPKVVVETGVLYGASSGHILEALARNGDGALYSIDLGCASEEPPNDFLVPAQLRTRWELIIGDANQELEPLMRRLPPVAMFHHDSLHTWEHMIWEFGTVLPYVAQGGLVSSDDVLLTHSLVELFRENAFPTFCKSNSLLWGTYRNYGLAVKH